MNSNLVKNDREYRFELSESFTFDDNNMFRELISHISEAACPGAVLDMSRVTSIDSAGLGMLMLAYEGASKAGKSFKILRPVGQVKRLLVISDFDKILKIEY